MADYTGFWRSLIQAAAAAAIVAGVGVSFGHAQDKPKPGIVKSLRGDVGLEEVNPAPDVVKQQTPSDGQFGRAYRQQPPLIPHRIDGYQVSRDFNKCMSCHDWPANVKAGAPKVSETHYVDRQGNRLDKIAGTRFFCTQCHVPQADAKPLVNNVFENATEVGGRHE
ncbi:cytochrome c-type protein NapB [Rhodoblastus acidophilus]|uniref:nitrate reductase cytochrome c-type subunit n=1 Tax=Rhodoblastus acidophilus TaxID=1074 RepID=UPI0022240327|nr:nitrate reductase cytochrome c-type subunit [Rhodoblastus acidophilus]MCW2282260.1 cytochrome c-type protein NapB [Rhodoblastus acidophilus]MCW2331335.1 cytochrome c-type protein NapB [Rhodoblastus acidophilus]